MNILFIVTVMTSTVLIALDVFFENETLHIVKNIMFGATMVIYFILKIM